MSQLFLAVPGRLVAIRSDHPRGLIFDVGPIQQTGIVTGLSIAQEVAAQFQPSLDRVIYAMPFGDAVGTLTVNMLLNSPCNGSEDNTSDFLAQYETSRFSPDNSTPVDLVVGASAYTGFMVGFQLMADSNQGHTVQATARFVAWMTK